MVLVDSSATFSTLLLRHLDECVGVDLVTLDDVLVGDLLASVGVHLGVVCTENLIRVDDVMESPKLAE
jgi:hypothetical protein